MAQLVKSFLAAEQNFDATTLSRLIDDRFVEVSPAGKVDAHDRFLGFYTTEKRVEFPPSTISEEQIRVFGNTAIDTFKVSFTMPGPDGITHARELRSTFVAQRIAGSWKLVASQHTGVRPVPAAAQVDDKSSKQR